MPDFIPPGAPPAGSMCVIPTLLSDLSSSLVTVSNVAGQASKLAGCEAIEGSMPGASVLNGAIAFEQSVGQLLLSCYDDLRALAGVVNGGLATVSKQDEANASAVCRVNAR